MLSKFWSLRGWKDLGESVKKKENCDKNLSPDSVE